MKTIQNLNLKEKKILLRCDFNVPLSKKGKILDDFRIKNALPTIEYLIKQKAKLILISHLGRPGQNQNYSLKLIVSKLEQLLKKPVKFLDDCLGEKIEREIKKMKPGEIILLENLRFHKGEEAGSLSFARKMAKLGDVYINDAFSASHRSHASIVGIAKFLPAAPGFLLQKEIEVLSKIIENPKRPLLVVIGGAKIESKIAVIKMFLEKADHVLLGGKIANSVLAMKGLLPLEELSSKEAVKEIKKVPLTSVNLHLPVDVLVSPNDSSGKEYVRQSALAGIKRNELLLDIGEETIVIFLKIIKEAKTIFWSGPLGFFENPLFAKGTKEIAEAIANNQKAFKVAGGGETAAFINEAGLAEKFNHISTGGGAMLKFLSGDKLPGIAALK